MRTKPITALATLFCQVILLGILLTGCATTPEQALQAAPPGITGNIAFQVAPLITGGYDISVIGSKNISDLQLRNAWKLKADQLAMGRKYSACPLVFKSLEDTRYVYTGVFLTFPITSKSHTLVGTLSFDP